MSTLTQNPQITEIAFERYKTTVELEKLTGITRETLRMFCLKAEHPLPHIMAGPHGKRRLIRPSVLRQWLEEEEQL